MMAIMPSPITIPTDEDLQVCELSNSVPDASPFSPSTHDFSLDQINQIHDYPFDFLPGEKSIEFAMDLTDGYIYLTTFRLFTYSNQTSHYSFINYPLRLIESIEIKDNVTLVFQCKDIRSFRLTFISAEKCSFWWKKFTETIFLPISLEEIFAFKYGSARAIDETPQPVKTDAVRLDSTRLRLDQHPWRITEINREFKLCSSYPQYSAVPSSMNDDEVLSVAKFRSYRRFPSVVWRHLNGAVLVRTSQPEVGWLFWRSKEDEKMIQAIIQACAMSNESNTINRLLILDARSYAAAIANRAKGGGFEHPPYYINCDVQFMNLPNIHAIRKSAQMLRVAISTAAQGETWLSQLESTRWLHNLSALIHAASFVVATIDKQCRPVLVHCSDGWDRTPQITTLAELMLDPYYRTIEGFQTLVEREWISYGHKFADRCGHGIGLNDPNERSPVFLQWLDCIYQLFRQQPTAFQFNEMFLLKLANHTYTCLYGTFLFNNDCERVAVNLDAQTISVWDILNNRSQNFINHLYDESLREVLYPSSSVRDLTIWSNLYLRDFFQRPIGLSEHPSRLMPARLRSFEDLSNSIIGSLHRSASNPSLSTSLHSESASNTTHSNSTNQPSPRLPISISAQCLSNSSPQQNLDDGKTHRYPSQSQTNNTSLPMHHSPITRLKQQSLPIDDSAPDITQLAISFQRFPMNLHGVESLLRTIGPKRKYTTSTSSTTSSLSETWSLPRIHSSDTNQTQRMVQPLNSNRILKLIRKRLDTDGLTKIPDQITSRMVQKERNYEKQIDDLRDHVKRMERFVCTIISINQHQQISPRLDSISPSNMNSLDSSSSCSSWQKIDFTDPGVTRWVPDFNAAMCYSCHMKFQPWPLTRKHHCRRCGNVFCANCANYSKSIPSLNVNHSVRVCRACFILLDENNNNTNPTSESTRTPTCPLPIQGSCRESGNPTSGSFPSNGGQKVKG